MKSVVRLVAVACLFAPVVLAPVAALAQSGPATAPTPYDQALAGRLMREIDGAIQCSTSQIATERELAAARVKIADLEKQVKDLKPADDEKK